MIKVMCRMCGTEVSEKGTCGCPNMVTVHNDKISAVDLSMVVMIETTTNNTNRYLTNNDLMWQEERRKRKVRRLDFEVR